MTKENSEIENPKTVREWVIFGVKYSSAIVVLLGAFWNYAEVIYNVVTGTNSAVRLYQERQLELWRLNKECLKQTPEKFETPKKELISLLLCPRTASLLVEVIPPEVSESTSTWIELNKTEKSAFNFGLYAQDIRQVKQGTIVIELCRWTDNVSFNAIRKYGSECFHEKTYFHNNFKVFSRIDCNRGCP